MLTSETPLWRRLAPNECFEYDYINLADSQAWGLTRGYCCRVHIVFDGHNDCDCMRSQQPEVITMFREHLEDDPFPLHYAVTDGWLNDIKATGFGIAMPGFTVVAPRHISYGYVSGSDNRSFHLAKFLRLMMNAQ